MREYLDAFGNYLIRERNRTENTVVSYKQDLSHFANFLEEQRISGVDKITVTTVMAYIMELEKSGKSLPTVCRHLAGLKTFFKYLLNNGLIESDPVYKIKTPKISREIPKCVDLQSIEILLEQPDLKSSKGLRDKAILELLFATGLKATEIITLKVSEVNLNMEYIECYSSNKKRVIPMGGKAVKALDNYLRTAREKLVKNLEEPTLFLNYKGLPFTRQGLWKIIKFYTEKAGLQDVITPSILRHSFAQHLVSNGVDMESLKEMLGHTDMSTTQIYFQGPKNKLKDVYNKSHPRQ